MSQPLPTDGNWGIMGVFLTPSITDISFWRRRLSTPSISRAFCSFPVLILPIARRSRSYHSRIDAAWCNWRSKGMSILWFQISRKTSETPGYTLAVVDYLRQNCPAAAWHLILGADNIAQFDHWHKPDELVKRVKIVVGNRPGYDREFQESQWLSRVETFNLPLLEISSTSIRKSLKERKSVRYLLPEEVRQFIESKGLYR